MISPLRRPVAFRTRDHGKVKANLGHRRLASDPLPKGQKLDAPRHRSPPADAAVDRDLREALPKRVTRHVASGIDMAGLNLSAKQTMAVPFGVVRSKEKLEDLVIHAEERSDGRIEDQNGRQYIKASLLTVTDRAKLWIIVIPDTVVTQVFVGKEPKEIKPPPRFTKAPGAKIFNDLETANSVWWSLQTQSGLGVHAVLMIKRGDTTVPMTLEPLAPADAFDVWCAVYKDARAPAAIGRQLETDILAELATRYVPKDIGHRDIKLENIFLDDYRHFTLGDHGHAQNAHVSDDKVGSHQAPEGYLGRPCDATKLDVWALTMSVMQIVTNQVFFSPATCRYYGAGTAGRAAAWEDMQAYAKVWQMFAGPLSEDDQEALRATYCDAPGSPTLSRPKPMARSHSSTSLSRVKAYVPHHRRGSRSAIPPLPPKAEAGLLALPRRGSVPVVEEVDWQEDEPVSLQEMRERLATMYEQAPDLYRDLTEVVKLLEDDTLAVQRDPELAKSRQDNETQWHHALCETLRSLEVHDPNLFAWLAAAGKVGSEEEFRSSLANDVRPLANLWRDMLHALEFTEAILRQKFERWQEADRKVFPLRLQRVHPLLDRCTAAPEALAQLQVSDYVLPAEEKAQVRQRLAQVEGKAMRLYKEYKANAAASDRRSSFSKDPLRRHKSTGDFRKMLP